MTRKLTVAKGWIEHEASSIEQFASDSLRSLILLGQTNRYRDDMEKVRRLRQIAGLKSIAERRTMLRELGYAV